MGSRDLVRRVTAGDAGFFSLTQFGRADADNKCVTGELVLTHAASFEKIEEI
jgi:hypothetical protein